MYKAHLNRINLENDIYNEVNSANCHFDLNFRIIKIMELK